MRLIAALLFTVMLTAAAAAERRVALVMGADDYETLRTLKNAVSDAQAIEKALDALDFKVTIETNRSLKRMRRALDDFREDAEGADVALVFFAGHGIEMAGENRLLPIDADASSVEALKASTLPLEDVRAAVAAVGKVGLILLDACRNDPFRLSGDGSGEERSIVALKPEVAAAAKPGFGRMGRAENILFAFAAAPGETASDGEAGHSPFTAALEKYLGTEGLEIRSVLTLVQQEVYDLSRGAQLPYVESGLPELFFASKAKEQLPERERLLLAMANITPDLRAEVERIAAERSVPLAPLFGAAISADVGALDGKGREAKLEAAAAALVTVRDQIATLASGDPQVTKLRAEAEAQLSLGAFEAARKILGEAAAIDDQSRKALKANFVERTISEAATRYLSGSAAMASLSYPTAIADYEKAASLFAEIDERDMSNKDRLAHVKTLESLGYAYNTVGDFAKASAVSDIRLQVASTGSAREPGNPYWKRELASSHQLIGDVQMAQGDLDGALVSYRAVADIMEPLVTAMPQMTEWQRELAAAQDYIGYVLRRRGDLGGAADSLQANLDMVQRFVDQHPDDWVWQSELTISHLSLGDLKRGQGDLPSAKREYRSAIDIVRPFAADYPEVEVWQQLLSDGHVGMGNLLGEEGDTDGARAAFETARAIRERLAAADPANVPKQIGLIHLYLEMSNVLIDKDPILLKALEIAEKLEKAGQLSPAEDNIPDMLRQRFGRAAKPGAIGRLVEWFRGSSPPSPDAIEGP